MDGHLVHLGLCYGVDVVYVGVLFQNPEELLDGELMDLVTAWYFDVVNGNLLLSSLWSLGSKHKAISKFSPQWQAWEDLVSLRENVVKAFIVNVLSNVKENVGALL